MAIEVANPTAVWTSVRIEARAVPALAPLGHSDVLLCVAFETYVELLSAMFEAANGYADIRVTFAFDPRIILPKTKDEHTVARMTVGDFTKLRKRNPGPEVTFTKYMFPHEISVWVDTVMRDRGVKSVW